MTWTKRKPIIPGYYWVQSPALKLKYIDQIFYKSVRGEGDDKVEYGPLVIEMATGHLCNVKTETDGWRFAGPIPEPEEE